MKRRTFLRVGAAGLTGALVGQLPALPSLADANYDLFAGYASRPPDGSFTNTTYLLSTRGGLWVHSPTGKSIESGSSTKPFHSGDWYKNVERVRVETKIGFHQPMALVVQGKVIGLDPQAGQTVGGVVRNSNPGLKVHVGFSTSDENYVISLLTKDKKVRIAINSDSVPGHYLNFGSGATFNWVLDTIYTFKVTWSGNDIVVHRRMSSDPYDGSNDVLLYQTTGDWADRYNSLSDPPLSGFYLDGSATRMYDYHVWQG